MVPVYLLGISHFFAHRSELFVPRFQFKCFHIKMIVAFAQHVVVTLILYLQLLDLQAWLF